MSTITVVKKKTNAAMGRSTLQVILVAGVITMALLLARYYSARPARVVVNPGTKTTNDMKYHASAVVDQEKQPPQQVEEEYATSTDITSGLVDTVTGVLNQSYRSESIPYHHCGPSYGRMDHNPGSSSAPPEVLLLHGAKFTHEDWKQSEILSKLCRAGNPTLSATAVDLPTRSNDHAAGLVGVVRALAREGVLSGQPLIVVTPSAGGAKVLALLHHPTEDGEADVLSQTVRAWVPVASPLLKYSDQDLRRFRALPVLALYGTEDPMGERVGARLKQVAGATVKTFEGGHAGYFQQQDVFVNDLIMPFVNQLTADDNEGAD